MLSTVSSLSRLNWPVGVFCGSIQILGLFFYFCKKKAFRIFIEILLNLYVTLDSVDILATLMLLYLSTYLCLLQFLSPKFYSFQGTDLHLLD